MGKTSIKMYDKFGHILRIETTTLDVTFLKHYRKIEQQGGTTAMKYAPMKTIYSSGALREVLTAANRRYPPSHCSRRVQHQRLSEQVSARPPAGFHQRSDLTPALIKKANRCYKYYLTALGRQTIVLGLKLRSLAIIPELSARLENPARIEHNPAR
jgi:hypothetical protein